MKKDKTENITTMENWKVEIKRLDKMRLDLGLNMNQVEKLTGVNRSRLKGFFEFTNIPSMKFYFDVKEALESQIEVKFGDIDSAISGDYKPFPTRGESFVETAKDKVSALVTIAPELTEKIIKNNKNNKNIPVFKEDYQFQNDCDCKLENGLLKRGKIACKKSKAEHNF